MSMQGRVRFIYLNLKAVKGLLKVTVSDHRSAIEQDQRAKWPTPAYISYGLTILFGEFSCFHCMGLGQPVKREAMKQYVLNNENNNTVVN